MIFFILISILFLFFFLKKFFSADIKKTKPSLHPFGYKLIYTDQKINCNDGVVLSKLLKSERFGVQGKPDFLYKSFTGKILPVELKSGEIGTSKVPHIGDMMQLATYFLIVEDVYGKKPSYGNLIYKDYMFKIKNTRSIRKKVLKIISNMDTMLETGKGISVSDFSKCRFCFCKCVCKFYGRK